MDSQTMMMCQRLDEIIKQNKKIIESLKSMTQILDVLGTDKIKKEHGG